MPETVCLSPLGTYVLVRCDGTPSPGEMRQTLAKISRPLRNHIMNKVPVDSRARPDEPSISETYRGAELLANVLGSSARVAVLNKITADHEFFEDVATNRDATVAYFKDEDASLDWLSARRLRRARRERPTAAAHAFLPARLVALRSGFGSAPSFGSRLASTRPHRSDSVFSGATRPGRCEIYIRYHRDSESADRPNGHGGFPLSSNSMRHELKFRDADSPVSVGVTQRHRPGWRESGRFLPSAKNATVRALLAAAFALGAFGSAEAANPPLAGLESLLIPGAGQLGNGDSGAAAAHFGIFAVSLLAAVHYRKQEDFLNEDERFDDANNRELINRTTLKYDYAARLATDAALYSSYAAYRDARARDNSGYRLSAPRESLTELAAAPFSFRYLARPTTFIPLAIQALAAFGKGNAYRIDRAGDVSTNDLYAFNFVANEMTAVGEEALFRGFLNNEFSDRYGNRAGLVISSAIFGLSHTGTGQTANALQATAAGLYLGWLHQRNGYEAAEGAALHYWINVLAGAAAIRNGESAQLVSLHFTF